MALVSRVTETESLSRVRVEHLFLGVVTVLGAALRVWRVGSDRLWIDELITLRFVTQHSALELVWVIPLQQPHLPLHYVVLRVWGRLFGFSVVSMRSLSVAASIAAIPAFYLLARACLERDAAWIATVVFAAAPVQIRWAQSTRMYAPMVLATIVSYYALHRSLDTQSNGWRWRYVAVTAVLANLHVYSWFLVAAQLATIAYYEPREAWPEWYRKVGVLAVVTVPWMAVMAVKAFVPGMLAGTSALHTSPTPGAQAIGAVFEGFVALNRYSLLAGVGVFLAITLAGIPPRLDSEWCDSGDFFLVALWLLAPFVGAIVVSYTLVGVFGEKYLYVASPAFYLLFARNLAAIRPAGRVILAVLVAFAMLSSLTYYYPVDAEHPEINEARHDKYIEEHGHPLDNPPESLLEMGAEPAKRGGWGGERWVTTRWLQPPDNV